MSRTERWLSIEFVDKNRIAVKVEDGSNELTKCYVAIYWDDQSDELHVTSYNWNSLERHYERDIPHDFKLQVEL